MSDLMKISLIGVLIIVVLAYFSKSAKPTIDLPTIELSKTDTIYTEIKVLELKQDTIKEYYEKEINNYKRAAFTIRIKLFADRINR